MVMCMISYFIGRVIGRLYCMCISCVVLFSLSNMQICIAIPLMYICVVQKAIVRMIFIDRTAVYDNVVFNFPSHVMAHVAHS